MEELYQAWRNLKNLLQFNQLHTSYAFHAIYGVSLFLIALFIFRKRRYRIFLAWLAVAAFEGLNEVIDIGFDIYRLGDIHVRNTLKDIIATMLIPTAILVGVILFGRVNRRKSTNINQSDVPDHGDEYMQGVQDQKEPSFEKRS